MQFEFVFIKLFTSSFPPDDKLFDALGNVLVFPADGSFWSSVAVVRENTTRLETKFFHQNKKWFFW